MRSGKLRDSVLIADSDVERAECMAAACAERGIDVEIATHGARALEIARRMAQNLDLVGLLAIEMFVTEDGDVLVNELAPRPHNSGHWTLDACLTSQFEQFIRAVAGLPLGATTRLADGVMTNLLGEEAARWREILAEPDAKLHLYGKHEPRPGRKMGHVTRLEPVARNDT